MLFSAAWIPWSSIFGSWVNKTTEVRSSIIFLSKYSSGHKLINSPVLNLSLDAKDSLGSTISTKKPHSLHKVSKCWAIWTAPIIMILIYGKKILTKLFLSSVIPLEDKFIFLKIVSIFWFLFFSIEFK